MVTCAAQAGGARHLPGGASGDSGDRGSSQSRAASAQPGACMARLCAVRPCCRLSWAMWSCVRGVVHAHSHWCPWAPHLTPRTHGWWGGPAEPRPGKRKW